MFVYEKKLQYPVNIKQTNAKLAKSLLRSTVVHTPKHIKNRLSAIKVRQPVALILII